MFNYISVVVTDGKVFVADDRERCNQQAENSRFVQNIYSLPPFSTCVPFLMGVSLSLVFIFFNKRPYQSFIDLICIRHYHVNDHFFIYI